MAEIVYVKGNILVNSRNFKYKGEDGCLFPIPEGAKTIEPTTEIDGSPFLVIDDRSPYSIFNSYRATGAFSTCSQSSYYYNTDVVEIYHNYMENISQFESMIESTNNAEIKEDNILYKYLIVSVISIFESFVRDLIVSRVASCEESFNNHYSKVYDSLSDKWKEQFNRMSRGELERKIISMLYDESFANASKINNSFKEVYNFPDCVCSGTNIGKYIKMRHQIAHKNARKEDGTYDVYLVKDVKNAVSETNKVVEIIMSYITQSKTCILAHGCI